MKKIKNKQKQHKIITNFIKFGFAPFLLISLWAVLTFLYVVYIDTSFSLLSYNLPKATFGHASYDKLQKADYISGKFQAQENNLGIISIRFSTFFRPSYLNEDVLLFQIKQSGSNKWYYENTYRNGLVYDVPFFPFGFPIIPNSKGKTYEFKITSLNGNNYNSVALSSRWQNIAAKYKFTKHELLQNRTELMQFSVKKFIASLETIDVLFSSLVYLLPLFFYLMLLSSFGKYLRKPFVIIGRKFYDFGSSTFLKFLLPSFKASQRFSIIIFDMILLGITFIDGFYLQLGNAFVYLLVPILWVFVQRHFKFTNRKTFIIGIILLLCSPIFSQFNLGQIAENMAVWAYLFLVAGMIHILLEVGNE